MRLRRTRLLLVGVALVAAGCGDDSDVSSVAADEIASSTTADPPTSSVPPTTAPNRTSTTTTTEPPADPVSVAITAIDFVEGTVTVTNHGDEALTVDGLWLCNFPDYQEISGAGSVAPGESLVIDNPVGVLPQNGELGLFSEPAFSTRTAMVSYVEWGESGHQRSAMAVEVGMWDGDAVASTGLRMEATTDEPTTAADWMAVGEIESPVPPTTPTTPAPTTVAPDDY